MTEAAASLTSRPAWRALTDHYREVKPLSLRQLFQDDSQRCERMSCEAAGLFLDYSKNRITDQTLRLLVQLANECGVRERTEAMFRGERINITENRPVLHVALRAPKGEVITVDGKNVVPEVHAVLDKMAKFADRVRSGAWVGHTGRPIMNIVNSLASSGSSPKAWTDETTPERVMNVPKIVRKKVTMTSVTFQTRSMLRRSCTITECRKAVAVNHGRRPAFSTGSHPQ